MDRKRKRGVTIAETVEATERGARWLLDEEARDG